MGTGEFKPIAMENIQWRKFLTETIDLRQWNLIADREKKLN
jgi:hypothetical protein